MDYITKAISYLLDYINSVPAHSWYVLGSLLASSGVVVGIIAWTKRHHLKKTAESLASHFIALNVVFWSTVTTVLTFILTNGLAFASFLPFLGTHMPQIIAISTVLYQVSKPSLAWWKARKDGKPISNPNLPNLTPAALAVNTAVPAQSFGTASAGVDVTPPPANLFQ